jgi:uncharacterized membrane protein
MNASLFLLAQQSTMPQFDGTFWLMLLSRILHILGAVILVGGIFYIRSIVSPVDAPPGTGPVDQYFGGRRATWAKWVGIATALLLVTGFYNYIMIIKQNERMATSWHIIAGMKMLLAAVVFLLAAFLAGRTAVADAMRQKWRTWLTLCLLLGIVTVAMGSFLRTYPRTKKGTIAHSPQLIAPTNATPQ